ncbi:MAG TPA: hypothetical protein VFM36_15295 [Thermoanaerobaculia bacterium]|nr:hypothetical protein [Thermoanaerobaculia bacterium]
MFTATRYYFNPGVRAGEIASIADVSGKPLLTYRSFASVVGIVATLVISIVLLTGLSSALFLNAEDRPGAAIAAAMLTFVFAIIIAALVPRTRVTLHSGNDPVLRIVQSSRFSFPATTWTVRTPDGDTLADIRKGAFSRLTTNRWTITGQADLHGRAYASEESLSRALVRKLLGKFRRKFEANVRLVHHGVPAAVIVRRPDEKGEVDYLELTAGSDLDPRVAVALATLVFGLEP